MYEKHELEQYFFDESTLTELAGVLRSFDNPCVLCAPLLGQRLAGEGVGIRILDVDERFAGTPGFLRWDLFRLDWLDESFGVIFCDPPFFNASLSRLFAAIRTLSHNDFSQPLLLTYLSRRAHNLLGTFAPFGLGRTGYRPGYQTVRKCERNEIELFANVPP